MVDSKDIVLGIIGFGISFYGGRIEDQFLIVSGILIIILTMYLKVVKSETDIEILKVQINTKSELNSIWRELNEIKTTKFKKRK